jgi:hypothetical protein
MSGILRTLGALRRASDMRWAEPTVRVALRTIKQGVKASDRLLNQSIYALID